MARTADWRIDFMRAHPRLFEILPDEPERFRSLNRRDGDYDI